MPSREDPAHRGRRRGKWLRGEVARELRDARRQAGLSQAAVGRRAGLSQNKVSRLERGAASGSLDDLATIASVVGLDMVVRFYPGATPLHDIAHVRLLARLQALVKSPGTWRTEVPLPIVGDQRAIDAVLRMGACLVGFELETRLADAQAVGRRMMLKRRDGGLATVILVVADTRWNRVTLAKSALTLRSSFPLGRREILTALLAGEAPPENGILVV